MDGFTQKVKMKFREIWMIEGSYLILHEKPDAVQERVAKEFGGYTHYREVVNINWDRIWEQFDKINNDSSVNLNFCKIVRQLIEAQLKGEE